MAVGTRGVPTIDGTPNNHVLRMRSIDQSGDVTTVAMDIDPAATDAQIEALVVAQQALQNASIFEVQVVDDYTSLAEKLLASHEPREDVKDKVVLQMSSPSPNFKSIRNFLSAPNSALVFVAGTEVVDPTGAEIIAWIVATEAVLEASYTAVGLRFTQRRQINQQIKV